MPTTENLQISSPFSHIYFFFFLIAKQFHLETLMLVLEMLLVEIMGGISGAYSASSPALGLQQATGVERG